MKPKAEFYDDVTGSTDTIDIGSVAKVLNIPNKRNEPYQEHVDKGYFRQNGTTHINLKTVVFQKGVDYIRQLALKKGR